MNDLINNQFTPPTPLILVHPRPGPPTPKIRRLRVPPSHSQTNIAKVSK